MTLRVQEIYNGSDGDATKALFAALSAIGSTGIVAVNLFRAQKASARAKVYRGHAHGQGSYRGLAYDRKQWAMTNLCARLEDHAAALGITWGWGRDDATAGFPWVIYLDLPTGQVSFHAPTRGSGPDYVRPWDGVRDASAGRIVAWCQQLLDAVAPAQPIATRPSTGVDERWCDRCCVWWRRREVCPSCHAALRIKPRPHCMPELRPGVYAMWDDEGDAHAAIEAV